GRRRAVHGVGHGGTVAPAGTGAIAWGRGARSGRDGMLWGNPPNLGSPTMRTKGTPDTQTIQSLDRGLPILEAVADASEPVPLKQLTDLIGIDRSSVFRLANTLRQRRFLVNPDGSKDYVLGPTAWRLSRKYGRAVLGTFFHDHLRALGTKLGET